MKIFKKKNRENEDPIITPKKARKLAKKAIITPTTYEDCLKDIKLRSERGYTWTIMLQVSNDVIDKLISLGWTVKIKSKNPENETNMVRIEW